MGRNLKVMGLLYDMRKKDILKDLISVDSCKSGWAEEEKWMVGKTS